MNINLSAVFIGSHLESQSLRIMHALCLRDWHSLSIISITSMSTYWYCVLQTIACAHSAGAHRHTETHTQVVSALEP